VASAAVAAGTVGVLSDQWLRGLRQRLKKRADQRADEPARIQRLLDDLPLAVLLFTADGLAYSNPAARAIFGAGARGVGTDQLLGGDGLAGAVAEAAETGTPVEVDVRREGRDLRARASVLTKGEIALVVSDLTESRRLDAIRRDFVTNASHELKTPVAAIQALADTLLLAFERDPERARGMLIGLRTQAVRLAQLVRDLLDLARLEEAAAQRARRVDVGVVVHGQLARVAELAEERDVTLKAEIVEDASIVAVPEEVRLIVGNLLENAVRYNRPGGDVRVSVRRLDGSVELQVADTGVGIPAADRDRVFERFYRVDKGRSRAAGGTGLGLSLVRHAVERHGGTVSLASEVDKGSTFTVVLPVEAVGLDRS